MIAMLSGDVLVMLRLITYIYYYLLFYCIPLLYRSCYSSISKISKYKYIIIKQYAPVKLRNSDINQQ